MCHYWCLHVRKEKIAQYATVRISRYELPIGGGEGEAARDIAPSGSGGAGGISTPGRYCCI
jgi:hypothetical protein